MLRFRNRNESRVTTDNLNKPHSLAPNIRNERKRALIKKNWEQPNTKQKKRANAFWAILPYAS